MSELVSTIERKIEEGLSRNESIASIARSTMRAKSSIIREINAGAVWAKTHALVRKNIVCAEPESQDSVCHKLKLSPYVCNGCKQFITHTCSKRYNRYYLASRAQEISEAKRSESRRGWDTTDDVLETRAECIYSALKQGLSPETMCMMGLVDCSAATIRRMVDEGIGKLSRMLLPRAVRYKKREVKREPRICKKRTAKRTYQAFLKLEEQVRESRWELDCVEGHRDEHKRLVSLLERRSRFQIFLIADSKNPSDVLAAIRKLTYKLGISCTQQLFKLVLTDNGSEFGCEAELAEAFCEPPGQTRIYYCDPMCSFQKGTYERNHVELRKILPKKPRQYIDFDLLTQEDARLITSHVNSLPRNILHGKSSMQVFCELYGDDAKTLLTTLGVVYQAIPTMIPELVLEHHRQLGLPDPRLIVN